MHKSKDIALFMMLLAFISLTACTDNNDAETAYHQMQLRERVVLDSMANDLINKTRAIEQQSRELDQALKGL